MDIIWLILLFVGVFLAVKVALFVVKGALKLAFAVGITAFIFYLITHINLLNLIH